MRNNASVCAVSDVTPLAANCFASPPYWAYKAEENIKGGLAYLRWLLAYYKGDVELVTAACNAGEGAVDKYKGVPPYPETRMYVKKIANLYNNTTHPYQDNFVKGSRVESFPKKKVM